MKTAPVTVTNPAAPFETNKKRFRMPGKLVSACPECGKVCEQDIHLNYPTANEPIDFTLCHEAPGEPTEHEWTVRIILRISVGPAPDITSPDRLSSEERINKAIDIITGYGGIDGAHHKTWVLDQALRILMGEEPYRQWVAKTIADGYDWEEGSPP